MHPFKIINKFFNTELKTKKELELDLQAYDDENYHLAEKERKLRSELDSYITENNNLLSEMSDKDYELEKLREESIAHKEVNDISRIIFDVTVDDDEEIMVVPSTQYTKDIIPYLVSNGYISMDDSTQDFAIHIGMVLCAYDACDTILNNFKGEE